MKESLGKSACWKLAVLCCLMLVTAAAQSQTGPLNDTGIDVCRDHTTGADAPVTSVTTCADGQDARYGRDPAAQRGVVTKVGGGSKGFDFTKIANDGSVLPASAVLGSGQKDWACTYDNNTGLMWEVKTISGLRGIHHSYTWYDSVHNYGGNPGTASGGNCQTAGRCDTEKFVADVNADGLCGHIDWRMPTVNELFNLVDLGIPFPGPSIDPAYFPNTRDNIYWSGSPQAGDFGNLGCSEGCAWVEDFRGGASAANLRSDSNFVRVVRSGK